MKDIAQIMGFMIALISALCIHEWAHAYAAYRQGDYTAEEEGRLTLNPIPHMDIFGTLLFPLMALMSGFPFLFGWAKPVPVNPRNFKNQKWGHAIVAFAGPLSNLICTVLAVLFLVTYAALVPGGHSSRFFSPLITLIESFAFINAILAFFNLIPVPPLDGGAILQAFLPRDMSHFFEDYIEPYGTFILLALLIGGGLSWIGYVANFYYNVVWASVAGLFGAFI